MRMAVVTDMSGHSPVSFISSPLSLVIKEHRGSDTLDLDSEKNTVIR